MAPDFCPHCGAEVPEGAKACPECGSCEETGWNEEAGAQGLDLPSDEFNYEEFVKRELTPNKSRQLGIAWYWWLLAILLAGMFIARAFF